MRTTQLHPFHEANAKLTEFAGYEMPLWYSTTSEEHLAVRNSCGIFDVSHMGRFTAKGDKAGDLLERLVPTPVKSQPPGKAFYTLLLNERAGIIDDLIIVKLGEDDYLVVVNAANAEGDMRHIQAHVIPGVEIDDITGSSVMIAVQGPEAASVLQPLTPLDLSKLKRFRSAETEILHQQSVISRTGYTGEDGFEVVIRGSTNDRPGEALVAWETLASASKPCGLSARDSLRLEAGFPLHGSDIDPETDPFTADLGWVVSPDKRDYVGFEEIASLRAAPPESIKRGVVLERGIPRHGFAVVGAESERVGLVTSGSYSPILKRGIALCRVRKDHSVLGEGVQVMVRDAPEQGRLVRPPFYDETMYGWKRTAQR